MDPTPTYPPMFTHTIFGSDYYSATVAGDHGNQNPRWTIPYHTIPYHTIPNHTIPYHTIPYQKCTLNLKMSNQSHGVGLWRKYCCKNKRCSVVLQSRNPTISIRACRARLRRRNAPQRIFRLMTKNVAQFKHIIGALCLISPKTLCCCAGARYSCVSTRIFVYVGVFSCGGHSTIC